MRANASQSWGSVSKALHWLMAALVVVQVPAGYLMAYTYGLALHAPSVQPLHTLSAQIHQTIGLLFLPLVAARLAWRWRGPVPASPELAAPLRAMARANHALLYAALVILPLSGWAALSVVAGEPVWYFTTSHLVPGLLAPRAFDAPLGYTLFARIHIYWLYLAGGLLAFHIAAAFWHHAALKDGVLRRMWPLASL